MASTSFPNRDGRLAQSAALRSAKLVATTSVPPRRGLLTRELSSVYWLAQTLLSGVCMFPKGPLLIPLRRLARSAALRAAKQDTHSNEFVHYQNRSIIQIVEPETRPGPLARRTHQPSLHRIAMYVKEFFQALSLAIHIEWVESPLPDPVSRLIVHSGRQAQARKHLLAPAMLPMLA